MDKNSECVFADKSVTYSQFVEDVSDSVAAKMQQYALNKNEISQRQAFLQFGRADVERWIRNGKLKPVRVSPGKIRYKVSDLIKLSKYKQNYLL